MASQVEKTARSRALSRLRVLLPNERGLTRPNTLQIRGIQVSSVRNQEIVKKEEAIRFFTESLVQGGTSEENAKNMAQVLHAADYRGHFSHGISRLEMYLDDLKSGTTLGCVSPEIIKETPNTAWVDGKNALGPVVGNFCMDLAIKKAIDCSVSWVVCKSSNHYGIASWYSNRAVNEGLIGMTVSNTSPLVVPTGGKLAALGTNPIAFAAPGKSRDFFSMDMATSNVAVGKIEVQMKKNQPIPLGWAVDESGKSITDASLAFKIQRLMPMGGILCGQKGYGLAVWVEILSSMLADSLYGPHIRKWMTNDIPANLSQGFGCVNPECFAPGFQERLKALMDCMRGLEPMDPKFPVQIPGDFERKNMKKANDLGGVPYDTVLMDKMRDLAKKIDVEPMKTTPMPKKDEDTDKDKSKAKDK